MSDKRPTHEGLRFQVHAEADPAVRKRIHAEIKAYNNAVSPHHLAARSAGLQPLDVLAADQDGEIIGGLIADTYWGWLEIDDLWVSDRFRGRGVGRRLVALAETEAEKRDCTRVFLRTFSFQARGMYEKLGYRVVGELLDYPPGEAFYWMRKEIGKRPVSE